MSCSRSTSAAVRRLRWLQPLIRPGQALLNPARIPDPAQLPEPLRSWDQLWCPPSRPQRCRQGGPRCRRS
jgi:hypothetical protein